MAQETADEIARLKSEVERLIECGKDLLCKNQLARRRAEAFESALRIRVWNQCRALGMGQDAAIAAVKLEVERVLAPVDRNPEGGNEVPSRSDESAVTAKPAGAQGGDA